jgi:hypothetical protein
MNLLTGDFSRGGRTVAMPYRRLDLSKPLKPIPARWGRWRLNVETLELLHDDDYGFQLERFSTAARMLDMVVQVHHKMFLNREDVGDFVAALDDLFDVQPSLTPFGGSREIPDVAEHLRRRFAERGLA